MHSATEAWLAMGARLPLRAAAEGFIARYDAGHGHGLDGIAPPVGTVAPIYRARQRPDAAPSGKIVLISRRPVAPVGPLYDRVCDGLLRSRLPVCFLPYRSTMLRHDRALILWDGSPSAQAAVDAALPLLRAAREVMLLDARIGTEGLRLAEVETLIRARAAHAHVETIAMALGGAASAVEAATLARADYTVMGGVGRWAALHDILHGDADSAFLRSRTPLLLGQ